MKAWFPSVYPYGTAEWVHAWVEKQIAEGRSAAWAGLTEPRAAYLHGSIGHHAALAVDGAVWLYEEVDLVGPNSDIPWRKVSGPERSWVLVLATQHFPELKGLLPVQPRRASTCARCKGSGFIHETTPCRECGALGWHSAEG
jgi:hypothetical protein